MLLQCMNTALMILSLPVYIKSIYDYQSQFSDFSWSSYCSALVDIGLETSLSLATCFWGFFFFFFSSFFLCVSGDWQAAESNAMQFWYENSHSAQWNEDKRKSFFTFLWWTFIPVWMMLFILFKNERQENGLLWRRKLISASNYILW